MPTVFTGPFGWTIDIHWEYHAWLMFAIWMVLVPGIIVVTRFGKPSPTPYGSSSSRVATTWWLAHRFGLSGAMTLSAGGALIALIVSGGFSGSFHSLFGIAAVLLGLLQVVVALFRGTHGGKFGPHSNPDDPTTWRGDHFDMTPHRRWFEAIHKQMGYVAIVMAFGAVTTGLAHYWLPEIAVGLVAVFLAAVTAFVILEGRGHRHDTYASVYGTHPTHPYNRARSRVAEPEPKPGMLARNDPPDPSSA